MRLTRRDAMAWGGGAIAGLAFTPVPWKLLDDVSIWSQNWGWIPQPARGPVEVRTSACTLCAHGCGLRVRLAGGCPVGLAGVTTHPVTRGALCPLGYGAHQLNWHPRRLRNVWRSGSPTSWQEATAAFQRACSEGPVAVIDGRPRRAASAILQKFAEVHGGRYATVLHPAERALAPYEAWSGAPPSTIGYQLDSVRTIVSFGAPLLDGFLAPGRFTRLWSERAAGQQDPSLRLIQIEPELSRTAACAWRWVAARPDTEPVLAAALARLLVVEQHVPARGPVPEVTVEAAAFQTGVNVEAIRDLARAIVEHGPTLVVDAGGRPAVAALHLMLGGDGLVRRSARPQPPVAVEQLKGNFRAVVIDASVPWEIASPVAGEVFRFAAWDGGGPRADWLLPAPGLLEELSDIPTAPASDVETYALAPALLTPPEGVTSAAAWLTTIDPALGSVDAIVGARAEELFRARKGALHGESVTPLAAVESAAKLREALAAGAVWVDDATALALRCTLRTWPDSGGATRPATWTDAWIAPVLPPLATKLYQESALRQAPAGRMA